MTLNIFASLLFSWIRYFRKSGFFKFKPSSRQAKHTPTIQLWGSIISISIDWNNSHWPGIIVVGHAMLHAILDMGNRAKEAFVGVGTLVSRERVEGSPVTCLIISCRLEPWYGRAKCSIKTLSYDGMMSSNCLREVARAVILQWQFVAWSRPVM